MTMILYELGGLRDCRYSLFSWRTRLALAHKGLKAEHRPVRVSDKAAIAFSGQTKVPILVDGEKVVFDSWRIAEYLEGAYGGPSLFGGPIGHGLARFVNSWADRQVLPAVAPLVAPWVVQCVDEADAAHIRGVMEKAFGRTLETMRGERDERLAHFRRVLDPARATLRTHAFLSGDAPAYADYVLFSAFQWARIAGAGELLADDDQTLLAWRDRVLDLFDGLVRRSPEGR
jgi:glutathione S-transferase